MPRFEFYNGLTLDEQLRKLALHHSNPRTRHLSKFELNMLEKAARNLNEIPGYGEEEGIIIELPIPTFEGEMLDYRAIWTSIQQSPSLAIVSEETNISPNKLRRINGMLNHFWEEGFLLQWISFVERIAKIWRKYSERLQLKELTKAYQDKLYFPSINTNFPTILEIETNVQINIIGSDRL